MGAVQLSDHRERLAVKTSRWSRHSRGQALVEFALILPILLILMLGILDFGRAVAAYNSVSNAARSAVRVAIVDQNPDVVEGTAEQEAVGLDPLTVEFDPNVNSDDPCVETVCLASVEVATNTSPRPQSSATWSARSPSAPPASSPSSGSTSRHPRREETTNV